MRPTWIFRIVVAIMFAIGVLLTIFPPKNKDKKERGYGIGLTSISVLLVAFQAYLWYRDEHSRKMHEHSQEGRPLDAEEWAQHMNEWAARNPNTFRNSKG